MRNNEVTIAGGEVKDVLGGFVRGSGKLTGNVVTITGGEIQGTVYAARSNGNSEIKDNIVNLGDGKNELAADTEIAKYIFGAFGGNRSSYAGNTLNVKASARAKNIVNFNKVNFYFTDTLQPKLTLRDSMGTKLGSLSDITVHGSPYASSGTLIENNTSGGIIIRDGVTSVVTTGDTAEMTLSKSGDNKKINYTRLIFKGARAAETDGSDAWGGRSVIGNTTTDNIVAVDSGTYTNVYGGWTSGAGSTADSSKQKNSTLDKVTVSGFTDVAGGKVTGNEVTIEKTISGAVVGGSATAEASNNMVAIHANTGAVTGGISTGASASGNKVYLANVTVTSATGGDGAVTHNNEIHLNGNAHVTNALIGGTQANGTGNTLHVKGLNNTAGSIINVQKMTFDVTGAAQDSTLLNVTGAAQTHVNWASLTATGMAAKPLTLLKNAHGINLDGYTGAAKSATTDTTETNVDVRKMGNKITEITYEGYTFKGTTTATTVGADMWGGRSKAGNTTTDNIITVDSGTHTNVYGGWTSGSGSTADSSKQKDSTLNTVTATNNLNADIVGGKSAGEASHNTVTVGNATVNAITGGDGAVTKDNTVNIDGATVTNKIVGGTQADGTGNTLNVRGVNTARNIGGFQKLHFDTTGVTGTMLTLNDGMNKTKVNWNTLTVGGSGYNITLLKNAAGIDFGGTYTDGAVKSGLSADRQSEINVGVSADKKAITYSGYRFTGATQTLVDGTAAYGGISKAGNATHHNAITVHGNYDAVYGGHTSGTSDTAVEKKHSHDNTVTITGGTLGTVYGGYTQIADGTTNDNTINLGDGSHPLAPNTTVATLYGGNKTAAGNTLNVNTSASVGKIENFSTVTFKNASSKLTLTQAGASIDLDTIKADFAATEREDVLVENANGLTLQVGKTFRTDLSADGTKETNIEARSGNKEIVRYGYTFKDARTATTVGADTWGGRSKAGNTTTGNEIALSSGTYTNVYGGWTSGAGSTADSSKQKNSTLNKVTVSGTASVTGTVYGGFTDVSGGNASGNTVNIDHAAVNSVIGGHGAVTNNNRINLRGAKVTGIVTGGTAANGTGNTLAVSYGMKTTEIGDFRGIQNLHFDMEKAPMDGTAHTMLKLTNVGGEKKLSDAHIDLRRDGAAEKLKVGDKITLMENTSGGITFGENLTANGTDGVTRDYEFAIASVDKTLIATVTKTSLGEQSKSFVETRTGASAFLNDGADFMAGAGLDAAKAEAARAAAVPGGAAYGLWAGMGGGALRHNTGSYVEMKGWNLGVGWARENAVPVGTLTFGPFLEYGRGSYDSYLDNGTHGDGTSSYIGAGVMAELAMRGGVRVDGALRAGRTKSDYTGLASYDTSNAYYGIQIGAGKDFRLSEAAVVSAYVRYAYTHTAGASAHLSTGETYEFDAVNSHRVRLGTRWMHGDTAHTQLYAGLAWEYEFDGAAHASYQGDRTPSPSLKGGSALLELGYRFAPKSSRVSYDLHLNGWQGKREGITGGVSVKWMF